MMALLAALLLFIQEPVFKLPSEAAGRTGPANLGFETGEEKRPPTDWELLQGSRIEGFSAELRRTGCRNGRGCLVLAAGPQTEKGAAGAVMQEFDATPFHGRRMRLSAWIRLESPRKGDAARVAIIAEGEQGEATFLQKGKGVEAEEWTLAEIEGKIPFRSERIQILVTLKGNGAAWIDDVRFDPVP